MKPTVWIPMAAVALAASSNAQTVRPIAPRPLPLTRLTFAGEPSGARIGVYLGDDGVRDTAGVLITSVVKDGPADKAGLKEGDRITAIGSVNLKLTRDDAEDPSLTGMMNRRLVRELDKKKPGDEVELHVWSGTASKTLRIKSVSSRDLETATEPTQLRALSTVRSDRPALGVSLGGAVTKRDTLGVFISAVTPDGPAEKAGVVEGDRIARINGVDLRVAGPDAGDAELSRAHMNRFSRELEKVKAGDVVTLTVVSGGRSRDVKVTAIKASDLPRSDNEFLFDGGSFTMPRMLMPDMKEMMPGGIRMFKIPDTGASYYFHNDGKDSADFQKDVQQEVKREMEKVRAAMEKIRSKSTT
jgi:predicted metalloprotease with PDZ domain